MELDIGKNMVDLLEKLAVNIGTTADKIFPWYLNQQFIEGCLLILMPLILIIGFGSILLIFKRKADFGYNWNTEAYVVLMSAVIVSISFLVFILSIGQSVSQVFNPEYHAFKTLTYDLSKLLGK